MIANFVFLAQIIESLFQVQVTLASKLNQQMSWLELPVLKQYPIIEYSTSLNAFQRRENWFVSELQGITPIRGGEVRCIEEIRVG